jgi:hypothetical protein
MIPKVETIRGGEARARTRRSFGPAAIARTNGPARSSSTAIVWRRLRDVCAALPAGRSFLGVATFVRLGDINREDLRWVIGMNLLRHAYLEAAPELRPYFITGWSDDEAGIMATFGARVGPGGFVHEFVTARGVLAVVDAVLAGVLAAILGPRLEVPGSITIGLAIVVGMLTIGLLAAYLYRGAVRPRARRRPRFPEVGIVSDSRPDPTPVR